MDDRELNAEPAATPQPSSAPVVTRRAVIDVGTNSVKLLVAEVAARAVHPLLEESEQTRLGRGFYPHHRLQADAIEHTAQSCAAFAAKARKWQANSLRIIATSAARDAVNAAELAVAVQHATGLPLEIISGQQEADWVFQGVTCDPALAALPLLILDVGGGSTEFILGDGGRQIFSQSFPLGSVRLLEQVSISDPPTAAELAACRERLCQFLRLSVSPALEPHWSNSGRAGLTLVGTGGATTILARLHHQMRDFDRARIEAARFTRGEVRGHCERLWSLPLAARRELPGLPPKRADVILFGVAIYEAVMEELGLDELRASTRGLRYAAVMNG